MADLNALIAQGAQFKQFESPVNMMAQMQQLQQGQSTNQLNQMKMQEYQRGMDETNALRRLDPSSPTYLADVTRISPEKGFAFAKLQREAETAGTEGQIKGVKLLTDKLATIPEMYRQASTPEDFLAVHKAVHSDPVLGRWLNSIGATPDKGLATLQAAAQTPGGLEQYRNQAMQSVNQILESVKPMTVAAGSSVYNPQTKAFTQAPAAQAAPTDVKKLMMERDALPAGDPNRAVYDQQIKDLGATAQNARSRLAFDQQKFAWDKANPGHELIQNADGEYYAVDKRTKAMTPLMVGGAAAAAVTPAAAGGVPVGRAAAPAGVPFVGKAAGMTESQGAATNYGMRMQEAHQLLSDLEKTGKTDTGLIKGVVGGTVGLVPYLGDKLEGATGSVFNALPRILGGLSPEQQQTANARINFITAVLRKESGASISPGEFSTAEKLYFPQPGDDAKAIAQKQKARELSIKGMKIQAGPGAKNIGASGISAPSANDPLGLR